MRYIDLHRHLEASHTPTALSEVRQKYGTPQYSVPSGISSWQQFADATAAVRTAYCHPDAVRFLSERAFLDSAQETDGFELRFSLASLVAAYLRNSDQKVSDTQYLHIAETLLNAVIEGKKAAETQTSVPFGLRFGLSRQEQYHDALQKLVQLAQEYSSEFSGLDVLGKETPGSFALVRPLVETLRADIPDVTIHAGELLEAHSVSEALQLQPNAIGHGIAACSEYTLLEQLAKQNVVLEVCPTSNSLLIPKKIAQYKKHPLKIFYEHGLQLVLGTDDPVIFGTTIQREYQFAEEQGVSLEFIEKNATERLGRIVKRPITTLK